MSYVQDGVFRTVRDRSGGRDTVAAVTLATAHSLDSSAKCIAAPVPHTRAAANRTWMVALTSIAVIAFALAAANVGSAISDYYASVAIAMSKSWPNFWFGALDPEGSISHDKIPGALWVPALLIRLFGYSPAFLIVPNAVAFAGSAVLVACAARTLATPFAGLVAGLALTTTPILAASARTNQPEAMFVLCMSLALWAASHAITRHSALWLAGAGAAIALGFQMYMIQAWAAWPAIIAGYLVTALPWARKLVHLAIAGVVSLLMSLSWIVTVELVPAHARPFIGSTLTNSAWELVFGYNALARFASGSQGQAGEDFRIYIPTWSGGPGVSRLISHQLATQIGWLVYCTAVAIVVLFVLRFARSATVMLAVWFATFATMYSIVAGMHQFTSAALAVPMSVALGCALSLARDRRAGWATIVMVLITGAQAVAFSLYYPELWYPLPVAVAQLAIAVVACLRVRSHRGAMNALTAGLCVAALLLSPAAWSAATIFSRSGPNNPVAGGMPDGTWTANANWIRPVSWQPSADFVDLLRGSARYDVAAFSGSTVGSILRTDSTLNPLSIGGFMGVDPRPSIDDFVTLIDDRDLRYVLDRGRPSAGLSSNTDQIFDWVVGNCVIVSVTDAPSDDLYDCTPGDD